MKTALLILMTTLFAFASELNEQSSLVPTEIIYEHPRQKHIDALKAIGCDNNHSIFENTACIDNRFEYENVDIEEMICKNSNMSLIVNERHIVGIEDPVNYITCISKFKSSKNVQVDKNSTCDVGFVKADVICIRNADNIELENETFFCAGRELNYDVVNTSSNLPVHLECKERPSLVEAMLSPDNVVLVDAYTELLGSIRIGIPNILGVTNPKLIKHGSLITISNKDIGIVALSDILELDKGNIEEYIESVLIIKELIRHIKQSTRSILFIKLYDIKSMAETTEKILSLIHSDNTSSDPRIKELRFSAIYSLVRDIKNVTENFDGDDTRIVDYMLDEYHNTYRLLVKGSEALPKTLFK